MYKPNILYIENRNPGHNSELHFDFIRYMHKKNFCKIFLLSKRRLTLGVPKSASFTAGTDLYSQIQKIIVRNKIDFIMTYNKNGSNYGTKDNISLYKWIEDAISKINLPKVHVTTDYCRDGFVEDQARWFSDLGYSAAIFRHKVSLEHPCPVNRFYLPFSVDKSLYLKYNRLNYLSKSPKVAFLGTSDYSDGLYSHRRAAIAALDKAGMLSSSKVIDKNTGKRQMITGPSYQRFLGRHRFGLTCGGTCNYLTAKYLQIPASGAMLVCTETEGLEAFPKDTYIKYSKSNTSKLIDDISYFIKNKKEAKDRAKILSSYVFQNHNHEIRAAEFMSILKSLV